jgi:hypothetical protein
MECREVLARYSDFHDRGLTEAVRGEIMSHLSTCDRCRSYQKILSEGITCYRNLPEPKLSDDFYLRLQHRLFHVREGSGTKRIGGTLVRGIVPTLSATAVFMLAIFLLSSQIRRARSPVMTAAAPRSPDVSEAAAGKTNTMADEEPGSSKILVRGGLRKMNERFIQKNIWNVLDERPTVVGSVGDGFLLTSVDGIVPITVSTEPIDPRELAALPGGTPYRPLGISVVPVLFQLEGDVAEEARRGLQILKVEEMSPAQSAGIIPGDIIVGLDHIPVENAESLARLVQDNAFQTKNLQVYRQGHLIELSIGL